MDHAHHILTNRVIPNVVEFVASLPWRLLMVVFPTLSPSPASHARVSAKKGEGKGKGGALAARLERLRKLPTGNKGGSAHQSLNGSQERSSGDPRARSSRLGAGKTPAPARLPPSRLPTEISLSAEPSREEQELEVNSKRSSSSPRQVLAPEDNGEVDPNSMSTTPSSAKDREVDTTPPRNGDGGRSPRDSEDSPGNDPENDSVPRRRSFGQMVRSAITGDFNVRVRDHLFDLKTASPSPPVALDTSTVAPTTTTPITTPGHARQSSPIVLDNHDNIINGDNNSSTLKTLEKKKTTPDSAAAARPGVADETITPPQGNKTHSKGSSSRSSSGSSTAPAARSKSSTRRRPSEFSPAGAGGGDAAAGGVGRELAGDKSSRGLVRRRNGTGRRATTRPSDSSTPTTASVRGTTARGMSISSASGLGGGLAGAAAATATASGHASSAESRASRLAEWRRKRAEQLAVGQQQERAKTGRTSVGQAGVASSAASVRSAQRVGGQGDLGRGGGGEDSTRPAAKLAGAGGRRFRHVERFRTEVGGVPASTSAGGLGAEDGESVSRTTAARVPSRSARTKRVS